MTQLTYRGNKYTPGEAPLSVRPAFLSYRGVSLFKYILHLDSL